MLQDERLSAQRAWRKQLNKVSNLIADSTNAGLLKNERTFLETRMDILSAANEKLLEALEDNYEKKGKLQIKTETQECEHSDTLRKVNERISEIKQEAGSYHSKCSGRDSQSQRSNGSSITSSLAKRTAIATSVARLKTELKFADAEAQKTSALKD